MKNFSEEKIKNLLKEFNKFKEEYKKFLLEKEKMEKIKNNSTKFMVGTIEYNNFESAYDQAEEDWEFYYEPEDPIIVKCFYKNEWVMWYEPPKPFYYIIPEEKEVLKEILKQDDYKIILNYYNN